MAKNPLSPSDSLTTPPPDFVVAPIFSQKDISYSPANYQTAREDAIRALMLVVGPTWPTVAKIQVTLSRPGQDVSAVRALVGAFDALPIVTDAQLRRKADLAIGPGRVGPANVRWDIAIVGLADPTDIEASSSGWFVLSEPYEAPPWSTEKKLAVGLVALGSIAGVVALTRT